MSRYTHRKLRVINDVNNLVFRNLVLFPYAKPYAHLKRKKILVYLEPNPGDQYFFTGNKLKCPYAPEFEDKCDLVLENMGWRHLLKNHPSKSHYRYKMDEHFKNPIKYTK